MRLRPLCWCAIVLLGACAQAPMQPSAPHAPHAPAPVAAPAIDPAIAGAVAQHRRNAQRDAKAGNLAAAEREWHVVTLLAPDDASARAQLDATRTAIGEGVRENLQAGLADMRAGDNDQATAAFVRVLALDNENAEAMKSLREIDRQKLERVQGERAVRANQSYASTGNGSHGSATGHGADSADSFAVEQSIELFRAGDTEGGLRDFHAFVDANPGNDAARARIAAVVYQQGMELEGRGAREPALHLYEQAASLRGKPVAEWNAHMQAVRKALSEEYYQKGMQAYRTDMATAIRLWETSRRYDPNNHKTEAKLQEARIAQEHLNKIENDARGRH